MGDKTPLTRPINPYEDVRSDAPTVIVPQVPLVVDFDGLKGQNLFGNFTPESNKIQIPPSQAKTISFDRYIKDKIDELPTPQKLQFQLDTAQAQAQAKATAKDKHLEEQIEYIKRKYDTQIDPYNQRLEETSKMVFGLPKKNKGIEEKKGGRRSKKRNKKSKKKKSKKRKSKKSKRK